MTSGRTLITELRQQLRIANPQTPLSQSP